MKKLIAFLIAIIMILCQMTTFAAESGSCGESVNWKLEDGILTISGTGKMNDYSTVRFEAMAPWNSLEYDTVIVEEGVTSIGFAAFMKPISEIYIPKSVETIGDMSIGDNATVHFAGDFMDLLLKEGGGTISARNPGATIEYNSVWVSTSENTTEEKEETEESEIELIATGNCGENIIWDLFSDGTLWLSGTGATFDYSVFYYAGLSPKTPWYDYKEDIKEVIIEEGVEELKAGTLQGLKNFDLNIASTVKAIGPFGGPCNDIFYVGSEEEYEKIAKYPMSSFGGEQLADVENVIFVTEYDDFVDEENEIDVVVNGKTVVFDQPPVLENNRTLVPLRAIFEALGAMVGWEDATQTVTASKGDIKISLQIGSTELFVNGEVKILDVPAKLINSRTLVPVRAISEAFGCVVEWVDDTQTVIITQ